MSEGYKFKTSSKTDFLEKISGRRSLRSCVRFATGGLEWAFQLPELSRLAGGVIGDRKKILPEKRREQKLLVGVR